MIRGTVHPSRKTSRTIKKRHVGTILTAGEREALLHARTHRGAEGAARERVGAWRRQERQVRGFLYGPRHGARGFPRDGPRLGGRIRMRES